MSQRVVLAYSGGLDTSVAVKWIQEEWGAEVVALAVDVGQEPHADAAYWEAIRQRAARRRRRSRRGSSTPARSTRRGSWSNAIRANAPVRGEVPARVVAVASGDRPPPGGGGPGVPGRRRRARLHRQGQRPGAVRGRAAHTRTRPGGPRTGPNVGLHPSRLDRVRRARFAIPITVSEDEAVLGGREHRRAGGRVRRDGGPVERAARRHLRAHAPRGRRAVRSATRS